MIAFNLTQETSASAAGIIVEPKSKQSERGLSFSLLLKSIKKSDEFVQNGALVLSLNDKEEKPSLKDNMLLSLLEIDPKVKSSLPPQDFKQLIKDAKAYLKDQIFSLEGFRRAEIDMLPRTLKGLVQIAKKLGIDVSKITLDEVHLSVKNSTSAIPKRDNKIVALDTNIANDIEPKKSKKTAKNRIDPRSDNTGTEKDLNSPPSLKIQKPTAISVKQIVHAKAVNSNLVAETQRPKKWVDDRLRQLLQCKKVAKKEGNDVSKIILNEVHLSVKNSTSAIPKRDNKIVALDTNIANDIEPKKSKKTAKNRIDPRSDNTGTEKDLNSPPSLKIQKPTAISVKQIVHAKAVNSNLVAETQRPKKWVDDRLRQLLQCKKVAKKDSPVLTSDFSVNSAKVIAPGIKSKTQKSLEVLLKPETVKDDEKATSKVDGLSVVKADSFELKLNEAKQMIRYLSSDIKQAIENYKTPFTKLKIQLNPQQLGEIEVAVIQRGKNIHVNLSSNNAAINTLAMNANDLKMQLQNNGINNASLNFSNNSQGQDQATSQHQQNREHAQSEYNYFENEEIDEEVLRSLEIVVPYYA